MYRGRTKLSYRIPFPTELLMPQEDGPTDLQEAGENYVRQRYYLKGVIVHLGTGLNYGHYIALVRIHGKWLRFDDDKIDEVDERYLKYIYGCPNENHPNYPCAYILVYEREDVAALAF